MNTHSLQALPPVRLARREDNLREEKQRVAKPGVILGALEPSSRRVKRLASDSRNICGVEGIGTRPAGANGAAFLGRSFGERRDDGTPWPCLRDQTESGMSHE